MGQIVSSILRCLDNLEEGPPPAHRYYHSSGGIGNALLLQKEQNHVMSRDSCSSYHIRIDSSPRNGSETYLQRKEEDRGIINKAVFVTRKKEEDQDQQQGTINKAVFFSRKKEEDQDQKKGFINKTGFVTRKKKEIVWFNHYSNCQRILLVGEGDFSFSASLAVAFGSACNIIATSLNSTEFLSKNYKNAMANIQNLKSRGAEVLHGVDANIMSGHSDLNGITFDRIIFNFPHSGFKSKESDEASLRRHRKLIKGFLANAKKMFNKNGGEIHISHKSNASHLKWNLEGLALKEGLQLVSAVNFNFRDYPGYHTKYGFGGDKNFNCNPSKTYMFALM